MILRALLFDKAEGRKDIKDIYEIDCGDVFLKNGKPNASANYLFESIVRHLQDGSADCVELIKVK